VDEASSDSSEDIFEDDQLDKKKKKSIKLKFKLVSKSKRAMVSKEFKVVTDEKKGS
jgi:hypothetical protein